MITAWRTTILDQLHSYEAPAAAAGPTALDVTKVVSLLTAGSAGTQDLYTLADAQVDQLKLVYLVDGTDTVRITPANMANGTYVELLAAGDYAVFEFNGIEWEVIYLARSASLT
jgi:hypothetical protein